MRGLGKMAKYKHLTVPERAHLKAVCQNILGTDASGEWDRAFRIRKEAGEALQNL
jgi:hypothetical protein